MKKFLLLLALFGLAPGIGGAATRYVQTIGVTTNCTTMQNINTPATSITAALNCSASGDIVYARGGTYDERISNATSNINGVVVAAYSTGTIPETVIIKPTAQNENAVIQMWRPDQIGGQVNQNIVWQDLILDGTNVSGGNVIYMGQSFHRFLRVEVKNNGVCCGNVNTGAAVAIGGLNPSTPVVGFQFSNGSVHDNNLVAGTQNGINAPYGFYDSRTTGTIIENSDIYNNGGYGIHGYSGAGDHHSATYRNNRVWDNQRVATGVESCQILASQGNNHQVYGNRVYQTASTGTQTALQNGICVFSSSGSTVYNNTVYNTPRSGIQIQATASTTTVRNNSVVNSNTNAAGFSNMDELGSGTVKTNNICFGTGGTGSCQITGQDPLFVSASTGNFALQSGSPAIDAGAILITPGITIPACSVSITTNCYNGTAPDIGAMESGVAVTGGPPVLTAIPSTVSAGGSISVDVNDDDVNERVENVGDWVGMYSPGSTTEIDWFYMNGTKTAPGAPISDAVIPFVAPSTPGSYEFRFYEANTFNQLAITTFTVGAQGMVMKFNISTLKIGPSVTWLIGVP